MICMITLTTASTTKEIGESVLFQPVLKAYPTCHSWIITAHLSLGHLEHDWKYFNRQMDKTCQLLLFLSHPAVPTHLLSPLQVELDTIYDMYNSHRPTIISAINLLNTDPSLDWNMNSNTHHKRSLLPFLGDALQWLTGNATTKDINSIKAHVNQLNETQSTQQDTLVHIVSILNVTRYAVQANRHSINILMDKVDETSQDVNNLYNLTTSLATSLSYHQLVLYIRSVLANLWDSLSYIKTVFTHTMDNINAATTGTLSPHSLPIFPSTKFSLWIFSMEILQLTMISILNILESCKMKPWQWKSHHNSSEYLKKQMEFCNIPTPFQLLVNLPSCITTLYVKNTASISTRCSLQIREGSNVSIPSQLAPNVWILTTAPSAVTTTITPICPGETTKFIKVRKPIHILWLPRACSATSPHFHLHSWYETTSLKVNISLDIANLQMINISSMNFHIWHHLDKHQNESQLQHLASILAVLVGQLYSYMAIGIQHITSFSSEESTGDTDSIQTLFSHTRVYVMAIGSPIPAGLWIFCCYFFWCWPAKLACWPLQPGNMQYTIVDDDVEAAPIYRCDGKTSQPIRPCKNHGLHIEHIPP